MKRLALIVAVLAPFSAAAPASAQVVSMPPHVQQRLAEVGPGWGRDIAGNIARTLEVYTPLLAGAPKAGVSVTRDVAYGPDPRHKLDVYRPEGGGAYVRGDRNVNPEVYGNVTTWLTRNGMVGVNATYRLAPAARWPAAAEDVGLLVKWLKAHARSLGGDPDKLYLSGHSARATHVASYVFLRELPPAGGHGVTGVVLMSGRYHFDPKPDDPNLKNFQAYFGTDPGASRP